MHVTVVIMMYMPQFDSLTVSDEHAYYHYHRSGRLYIEALRPKAVYLHYYIYSECYILGHRFVPLNCFTVEPLIELLCYL